MKSLIAILTTLALASCATDCGFYNPLMKVIPLEHASAVQVADKVMSEEKSLSSNPPLEIVADPQQNSIVVEGRDKVVIRAERRIRELDVH